MKRIIMALLAAILFCACEGSVDELSNETTSGTAQGTAPQIDIVRLYNVNDLFHPTVTFNIGDKMYYFVWATDPDLDITTLFISTYYPHDSDTPYSGPETISLPSQSATETRYQNYTPIEIIEPAGYWGIEFELEDSQGNKSDTFTIYVDVFESEPE